MARFLAILLFALPVHASFYGSGGLNVESSGNSTTTPLSGGATFTGSGEVNALDEVFCQVLTDADGTLYFDFSIDGTNWDSTYPVSGYDIDASIPSAHKAVKSGRHFRARLVNGSSAQTYLRMKCYYGPYSELRSSANQAARRDADAKIVRIYAPPQDEIVLNQRTGVGHYTKFAYLPDVDTADNEIMITADPAKPTAPEVLSSAETFSIAYTAANDGAGGGATGCTTLFFDYVDSDGNYATGSHVLGSSSPDTTSFSGFGINRVACAASGTADTNVAAITVTSSSSGGVHAYIPAGQGVTQQAMFHVPSNSRGIAKFLFANVNKIVAGGSPRVTLKGWIHNRTVDTKFEVFRYVTDTAVENHFVISEPVGFALSAGDILYFTASTTVNNTTVSSLRFSMNIYENN